MTKIWGKLLICKCGRKFNQHFHDRKDRHSGVDYQCYTSANRGSLEERTKRGLSTETACDSPYIPGWKLDLMAKQIFENYLENTSKVLELSYSMIEKHIADKEEIIDNSDVIKRKQDEIDKLNRKRNNLFEMREDGDIDKDYFRERKAEIENAIEMLTNEIKLLEPQEPKRTEEDFTATLNALKAKLESYVAPDTMKIPESVVEAFIERIWVSKDEFRWYLRRGNEKHRECSDDDRIKIAEFQVNLEQAKAYQYSFSTRKRVYKWVDLNVSVWL